MVTERARQSSRPPGSSSSGTRRLPTRILKRPLAATSPPVAETRYRKHSDRTRTTEPSGMRCGGESAAEPAENEEYKRGTTERKRCERATAASRRRAGRCRLRAIHEAGSTPGSTTRHGLEGDRRAPARAGRTSDCRPTSHRRCARHRNAASRPDDLAVRPGLLRGLRPRCTRQPEPGSSSWGLARMTP